MVVSTEKEAAALRARRQEEAVLPDPETLAIMKENLSTNWSFHLGNLGLGELSVSEHINTQKTDVV